MRTFDTHTHPVMYRYCKKFIAKIHRSWVFLNKSTEKLEDKTKKLEQEIAKLNYFIANLNENFILKKLENFSNNEFNTKNKLLNIQREDILLVSNPNQFSEKVISELKDKINIVISKTQISKNISLPFNIILAAHLKIKENELFAFVNKNDFEKEKNKINLLANIIESYKKEREQTKDNDKS